MKNSPVFLLFILFSTYVFGQNVEIDLIKQTINDRHFSELTVDSVTKFLGRPSAVSKNELIKDMTGPNVYYHSKALAFTFNSTKKDSLQRCNSVIVYLSQTWDKKNSQHFMPFSDKLVQDIDANKQLDYVKKLLGDDAVLKTAEQNKEEINKVWKSDGPFYHTLDLKKSKGSSRFVFEEVSKFLERIILTKSN